MLYVQQSSMGLLRLIKLADVAELADAHGSGPCAARLVGSTPTVGTIAILMIRVAEKIAGMAYRLCTSLPSWLEGFDPPYPLHTQVVEFPSGQRGQTVNLLARLSMVRIHLPPPSLQMQSTSNEVLFLFRKFGRRISGFYNKYDQKCGYNSSCRQINVKKLKKYLHFNKSGVY